MQNSGIKKIVLPSTVKDIDGAAFEDAKNLKNIKVDADNKKYTDIKGVLFNKAKTNLIAYPEKGKTEYKVPKGTKTIGVDAFSRNNNLEKVIMPDTVTKIKSSAFILCKNLKTVKFSKNIASIEDSAFYGCKDLTELVFPVKVKEIDDCAFELCTGLKKVVFNNGLKKVGSYAFNYCPQLKSVEIPASVTEIGEITFGCNAAGDESVPTKGEKIKGFVLKGYKGTEAEKYAKRTGITFKAI